MFYIIYNKNYPLCSKFHLKYDFNSQGLGDNLVEDIKNITSNVHLGFGSFVDKVMMPYASTVTEQFV